MAAVLNLDDAARARLADRFGPGVAQWCDELPGLVAKLARRWGVRVERAVAGNTGRTLLCRTERGELVVLKLTPERDIAETEAAALLAWRDCPRVVDVLDTDLDAGAVLLAGIEPGTPLTERGWTAAEIDELLPQLHAVAVPDGFPTLAERVRFMFDLADRSAEGFVEPRLMVAARAASLDLAAGGSRSLLHGDLHPGNVLAGADGVVVIDPRPCVGDPDFDAVDWVLRADRALDEAVAALPSADPVRLRRWSQALAVLLAIRPLRREGPSAHTDSLLALAESL
ncbi:aminoglycoside phosphotransferase family protein [Amycolatopsis acidiphila]|uniref:Phosphotransferase n=1 Tax=Amycolatopsis acidiphila TaxID=715473 RepID=A0A558AAU8_9PSEU|nr:aminoglycoside phosphotransferase family protein [Amycolatopsis acidiphila]TVT21364.1 phosphotransferase [Amycolatopsis acidiphila]UIJ63583.1 aminoglycoside phosphotransferase family protein [Amycolatopsis acidiphila]GHG68112.1 aminoglycoside O-phosphotransferase [Amycolatopsis acidiphila]